MPGLAASPRRAFDCTSTLRERPLGRTLLGEPVVLFRTADGALHAFANTCRHRGHELLPCGVSAQNNSVICPYHSWTYSLSGGLRFAQGFKGRDGFDNSAWGLTELPVAEWHGLIFVDGSGQAPPLSESLRELDELVAPYEPERLVTAGRHEYDAAANWKILTENYHECYHCPMIHPELCRVSPPKSGENYPAQGTWVGGWMDLRDGMDTMSLDGTSLGVPLRGLDAKGLRTVIYVNIFPNVLLSLHPDYVMTHRLTPIAVNRTMIECTWAFAPEALEKPGFDPGYAVEFWDITNQQDWGAGLEPRREGRGRQLTAETARSGELRLPFAGRHDAIQHCDDRVQLAAEVGLDPAECRVDPAEALFGAGQLLMPDVAAHEVGSLAPGGDTTLRSQPAAGAREVCWR